MLCRRQHPLPRAEFNLTALAVLLVALRQFAHNRSRGRFLALLA